MNDIADGEIAISEVTENELQELAVLCAETFYNTYYQQNTVEDMELYISLNFTVAHIQMEFHNPLVTIFVARYGKKLVGYIKLLQVNTSYVSEGMGLEIARFYVDEQYQKFKIGRNLMNKVNEVLFNKKLNYLWLGVWQKNISAIAIYQHMGFQIIGNKTFILGADVQHDFIMVKKINV